MFATVQLSCNITTSKKVGEQLISFWNKLLGQARKERLGLLCFSTHVQPCDG